MRVAASYVDIPAAALAGAMLVGTLVAVPPRVEPITIGAPSNAVDVQSVAHVEHETGAPYPGACRELEDFDADGSIDAVLVRTFDPNGRPVREISHIGETVYFYDRNGRLVERRTLASGRTWRHLYAYNAMGRLIRTRETLSPLAGRGWLRRTFAYDERGRLRGEHTTSDGDARFRYDTTYTYAGNQVIEKRVRYWPGGPLDHVTVFTHDERGRVATETVYGRIVRYTYDRAGNMLAAEDVGFAGTPYYRVTFDYSCWSAIK